jgi:hypothetical protein
MEKDYKVGEISMGKIITRPIDLDRTYMERDDRARRQVQAQAQGRRGQRKWKDRLPRKNTRVRGRQEVYTQGQGQGRGTTGMGVLGNLFR